VSAARLQEPLGLDDDELLTVLDAGPLEVVSGDLDYRPELPILMDLLAEAEEAAGAPVLQQWVRREGPAGCRVANVRGLGGARSRGRRLHALRRAAHVRLDAHGRRRAASRSRCIQRTLSWIARRGRGGRRPAALADDTPVYPHATRQAREHALEAIGAHLEELLAAAPRLRTALAS
jgi:hypothetical protein